MTYPAKYPPAVTPANWNAMVDRVNGFTPSGTFVSPYTYVISTDDTYYYASNAFQIIFGGPDDTGGVDGTDPQAVFDACIASHKKRICFATGTYSLDIILDTIDSLTIEGSNKNSVVIDGVLKLQNCWGVDVKQLQLRDTTRTKTMILFKAEDGESVWNCTLEDVFTLGGDVGIDFQTSGDGWINVNCLNCVWLANGNKGMTQSVCTGTDKPNGNLFIGLSLQCDASTTEGLTLPKGTGNTYLNCNVFDAGGGVNRCTVATGADKTIISGGNLTASEFVDNGTWTTISASLIAKSYNVDTMTFTNDKGISSWNYGNTNIVTYLKMTTDNIVQLDNTLGDVYLKAKTSSAVILGASGRTNDVIINLRNVATAESTLERSQRLLFYSSRWDTSAHSIPSAIYFNPLDTAADTARLTFVGAETSESAGAASLYLFVTVNGTSYKIPLHATS